MRKRNPIAKVVQRMQQRVVEDKKTKEKIKSLEDEMKMIRDQMARIGTTGVWRD